MKQGIFYEIPDKYKYSTIFASEVKPITSKERDKYLSLASKNKIKELFPEVDLENNDDLLGIWGSAFVANRINANSDGVKTKEAIDMAKSLKWKFLDSDHKRDRLVGFIVNTSYSEFGTNKLLTEEEVSKLESPFNVDIGGIIWKIPNPTVAEYIEASGDPESQDKLYFSWECAFIDNQIILLEGNKKNIEDGKIIDDPKQIKELEAKLPSNGGSGKTDDGKRIARIIVGEIYALGVGLVEDPAAQVNPIQSVKEKSTITIKSSENDKIESNLQKINNILQLSENDLSKFSKDLTEITTETSQSFDDVSKAACEFSKQGLNVEEILKRTKDALVLVRLSGLDINKSVECLSAVIKIFNDKEFP
ncbi:MAG: hypothetical protein AABY22_16665 [Nanoarchaeota archaeon]